MTPPRRIEHAAGPPLAGRWLPSGWLAPLPCAAALRGLERVGAAVDADHIGLLGASAVGDAALAALTELLQAHAAVGQRARVILVDALADAHAEPVTFDALDLD